MNIPATNPATGGTTPPTNKGLQFDTTDVEFAANFDMNAVNAALATAMEGVAENMQLTNAGPEGLNPARPVIIRTFTDENANKFGAAAIQYPTLEELMADPKGADKVHDIIKAFSMRQISQVITSFIRSDRSEAPNIPSALVDFITASRTSSGTGAKRFKTDLWREFRTALKEQLISLYAQAGTTIVMNNVQFEQSLENQSVAAVYFPMIKSEVWDQLVDKLCQLPPKEYTNKKTGATHTDDGKLFKHWKATRHNAVGDVQEVEITLDALSL